MHFLLAHRYVASALRVFRGSGARAHSHDAGTVSIARQTADTRSSRIRLVGSSIALAALLGPPVAAAPALSDCESTSSLCMTGCAATGAIGSLLGGGGANAAQQCRVMCSEQRRECEQQARAAAPVQSAPVESVQRQPDRAVEGARNVGPIARSESASVNGESIVLLTVKPKDPFSPALVSMPVAYIHQALSEQEARRNMRPKWVGPARQHSSDAGVVLFEVPVMTRQKFVEATLAAYEKQGGKRSNVRIDVLSVGAAADSRSAEAAQRTPASRTAQVASAAPAASSLSNDRDCVKQRSSTRVDQRGNRSYFFVKNDCSGPVTVALSKGRSVQTTACYPGVVRPGAESELGMGVHAMCLHAGSVSPDQAMMAQDVRCQCPAGAQVIAPMTFNAAPGDGTAR